MKKVKEWLRKKYMRLGVTAGALAAGLVVAAGASEVDSITSSFTTGFTKIASDAVAMIAVIVPIALGVAGTVFLVKKAMGWFKGLAK